MENLSFVVSYQHLFFITLWLLIGSLIALIQQTTGDKNALFERTGIVGCLLLITSGPLSILAYIFVFVCYVISY